MNFLRVALALLLVAAPVSVLAADPLPSWRDAAPKQAIVAFVERVTKPGSADFVAEPARIAIFDNDGTLWSEQPVYNQLAFVVDRVKALAPQHPEWATQEPFASLLKGDLRGVAASGEAGLGALMAATHADMTTDEFSAIVSDWIGKARHPKTGRPYTEMAYQPMLELLAYLRASGFKTYIVSGGGIEFMRPWAERTYGIPPEQVVGSMGGLRYEVKDGQPVLMKTAELAHNDDREGKPVGIQRATGRRPLMAFGNSDGDFQMLEWTTSGPGPRFGLLVHHTDAEREWAYDRESHIGRLARGLDEAAGRGWIVVDMKEDWNKVFPFQ